MVNLLPNQFTVSIFSNNFTNSRQEDIELLNPHLQDFTFYRGTFTFTVPLEAIEKFEIVDDSLKLVFKFNNTIKKYSIASPLGSNVYHSDRVDFITNLCQYLNKELRDKKGLLND